MKFSWIALLVAALFVLPVHEAEARKSHSAKTHAGKSHAKGKAHGKSRAGKGKRGRAGRHAAPVVLGEGAATPVRDDPVVKKNIPLRAYAADPQTFYLNGQKIHVRGAPYTGPDGSELAKQRLQKLLDGGNLTVADPRNDGQGGIDAVVRINGRDIADQLLVDELRSGNLP